jgi:hypothetical protein
VVVLDDVVVVVLLVALVEAIAGSSPSWTRNASTLNTATTLATAPTAKLRTLGARRFGTFFGAGSPFVMSARIDFRPQPFLNRPWDLPELRLPREETPLFGVTHPGYPSPMSLLKRWLRRVHRSPDDEWRGNEFGWALREISGEARHPRRENTSAESTSARHARSDSRPVD